MVSVLPNSNSQLVNRTLSAYEAALQQHCIISKTDLCGRIKYVNQAFINISEYSSAELINKDHRLLNSGRHQKEFFKQMWAELLAGKTWRGKIQNRSKFGKRYWVDTIISPIHNEFGEIVEFLSVRFDITRDMELRDEELQQAKLASLGLLAAGMAHEINNPLAILSLCISRTKRIELPNLADRDVFADTVEKMNLQIARISKVVDSVLKFSRSSKATEKEYFPLSKVILESVELMNIKLKNMFPIRVKIEADPTVYFFESRLAQVLVNLIQNSSDAIENNTEKWIEIRCHSKNGVAIICMTDSGKGIPEDIKYRIFDPFFTTKPIGKGTGLGLSICKGILNENGADIRICDDTKNTCFEILIPVSWRDNSSDPEE